MTSNLKTFQQPNILAANDCEDPQQGDSKKKNPLIKMVASRSLISQVNEDFDMLKTRQKRICEWKENKANKYNIRVMRSFFPARRIVNPKQMLCPVDEEDCNGEIFIDFMMYNYVFTRVHGDIKMMTIDPKVHQGYHYMSPQKLKDLVDDLIAIKSCKYNPIFYKPSNLV